MAIGESATTVTVGDVAVEEVVIDAFPPGC